MKWLAVLVVAIQVQVSVSAQQLVVVRRDKVRLRFSAGEPIYYSIAGRKGVRKDVIMGFVQDKVILYRDTVHLLQLRKIGNPSHISRYQDRGAKVLTAGILLALGDFVNVTLVQHGDYRPDAGVTIVSAGLITTGIILLKSKPVIKINRRNRLAVLSEGPYWRR